MKCREFRSRHWQLRPVFHKQIDSHEGIGDHAMSDGARGRAQERTWEGDDTYSRYSWFNGQIGDREEGAPSVASGSFHLGTSVFDGMMAYWNRDHYYLHRAEAHLVRFREGAKRMG